jgi:hypothetical protein
LEALVTLPTLLLPVDEGDYVRCVAVGVVAIAARLLKGSLFRREFGHRCVDSKDSDETRLKVEKRHGLVQEVGKES